MRTLPVAVISGWSEGQNGALDENLCLHYPDFAHPESVLDFMKIIAGREARILAVHEAIPVAVTSVHDGTTDFSWQSGSCSYGQNKP